MLNRDLGIIFDVIGNWHPDGYAVVVPKHIVDKEGKRLRKFDYTNYDAWSTFLKKEHTIQWLYFGETPYPLIEVKNCICFSAKIALMQSRDREIVALRDLLRTYRINHTICGIGGSFATGTMLDDSDIDLLIYKEGPLPEVNESLYGAKIFGRVLSVILVNKNCLIRGRKRPIKGKRVRFRGILQNDMHPAQRLFEYTLEIKDRVIHLNCLIIPPVDAKASDTVFVQGFYTKDILWITNPQKDGIWKRKGKLPQVFKKFQRDYSI